MANSSGVYAFEAKQHLTNYRYHFSIVSKNGDAMIQGFNDLESMADELAQSDHQILAVLSNLDTPIDVLREFKAINHHIFIAVTLYDSEYDIILS